MPCCTIVYVPGNHFEKKPLPLRISLKIDDVLGEPVVHLFARGPRKNGEVAKTNGLFFHFVEASEVATIELLEAAPRSGRNGNAGGGCKIIVGKDAMWFWRICLWSGGWRGDGGILFCGILSPLRRRWCVGRLRRARKDAMRREEKSRKERGCESTAQMDRYAA